MTTTSHTNVETKSRGNAGIFLALAPWVLFTVIAQHSTLKSASIAALVIALLIALPGIREGAPKLLELGAIAAFAGFTVVAFASGHSTADWLEHYARAIAAGLLAVIALGSLAFVPFTEQYARAQVPEAMWSSPRFKAVNRKLTLLWAGVFAAMVPAHIVAGAIDAHAANIALNWVVPILLVLYGLRQSEALAGAEVAA